MAIIFCTCKHDFQDRHYGTQMRAHNYSDKGWLCTVCGNVKVGKADSSKVAIKVKK